MVYAKILALMVVKKIKGHKRHIVVDTEGHLLHIEVHAANIHDTISGGDVVAEAFQKYPSIKAVCADAGYRKTFEEAVREKLKKGVDIAERIVDTGWAVIPKRWVVERTFAWLNGARRLAKDFEYTKVSAKYMVIIAHIRMLIKRCYL